MNEINKHDKYERQRWFEAIDAVCDFKHGTEDYYEWAEYVSGKQYKCLHYVLDENLHAYKILSRLDDEARYSTSDILLFPNEVSKRDVSDYTDELGVFNAPSLYIAMNGSSASYFKIGHITGEDYDKREGRIEYIGEKLGIYLPKDKGSNYMDEEQFNKSVDLTATPDIILRQAEEYAIADNNLIVAKDFADASKFYTKVEDVVRKEIKKEAGETLLSRSAMREKMQNYYKRESKEKKSEEDELIDVLTQLQKEITRLKNIIERTNKEKTDGNSIYEDDER